MAIVNPYLKTKNATAGRSKAATASSLEKQRSPYAAKQVSPARSAKAPPSSSRTAADASLATIVTPAKSKNKTMTATRTTTTPLVHPRAASVVTPQATTTASKLKNKLTLKLKLKTEIKALQKEKQLLQWQKEAKERAALQAQQEAQARRQAQQRQEERARQQAQQKAAQEERRRQIEQQKQERLAAQQRKLEEKKRAQQQEEQALKQAQEDFQKAVARYQQETADYQKSMQNWTRQRNLWMQAASSAAMANSYTVAGAGYPAYGPSNTVWGHGVLAKTLMVKGYWAGMATAQTALSGTTVARPQVSTPSTVIQATVQPQSPPESVPTTTLGSSASVAPYFPNPNTLMHPTFEASPAMTRDFMPHSQQPHPQSSPHVSYFTPSPIMSSWAWTMQVMQMMPPALQRPPIAPTPPTKPRLLVWHERKLQRQRQQSNQTSVLSSKRALEPPSPWARPYLLFTTVLIRTPDQPSFGVNLKCSTQSVLVEPDAMEKHNRNNNNSGKKEKETVPPNNQQMAPEAMGAETLATVSSAEIKPQKNEKETEPIALPQNDSSKTDPTENHTPMSCNPQGDNSMETTTSTSCALHSDTSIPAGKETNPSSGDSENTDSDPSPTKVPESTTAATQALKEANSSSMPSVASEKIAEAPRRPRRKRVHFSVMMVIDAEKHNQRLEQRNFEHPSTASISGTSENVPRSVLSESNLRNDQHKLSPEDVKMEDSEVASPKRSVCQDPKSSTFESKDANVVDKELARTSDNTGLPNPAMCNKTNSAVEKTGAKLGSGDTKDPISKERTPLEPGDIVLSIGGVDVAGKTFAEACRIFQERSIQREDAGQTFIEAQLLIARPQKPKPVDPIKAPIKKEPTSSKSSATSSSSAASKRMPYADASLLNFSSIEMAVLADCVIQAIHDQPTGRLLGHPVSKESLERHTSLFRRVAGLKDCGLKPRNPDTLFDKWAQFCRNMQISLADRGRAAWTQKTIDEESVKDVRSLPFSSDAERTALRQLPRPPTGKGCRCRQTDHQHVHDVRCTLYQDLCRLIPADELKELQFDPSTAPKQKKLSAEDKNLNTVGTATKDRFLKSKGQTSMEEAEARFVARMEECQIQQLHKAIFAPNLCTMVLSSIVELQREYPRVRLSPDDDTGEAMDEDEDLEENLTLQEAGKRKLGSLVELKKRKKQKQSGVPSLNYKYLLRISQLISKTWGHVYREPTHEDYAWRWEIYHGHNSEQVQWESHSTNPRSPGALTFESLCHSLEVPTKKSASQVSVASNSIAHFDDALTSECLKPAIGENGVGNVSANEQAQNGNVSTAAMAIDQEKALASISTIDTTTAVPSTPKLDLSKDSSDQLALAAFLLSPSASGFYDELIALTNTGVVEINSSGVPLLVDDWASKVDYVILEDMEIWSDDNANRFCLHPEFTEALKDAWERNGEYWVLSRNPEEVVFDINDMEEWRQFFQGQLEEQANFTEGIGRFGL